MARVPVRLRMWDKLAGLFRYAKVKARNFLERWSLVLNDAFSDFRKTWLYDHVRFVLVYGLLLAIVFAVLFGHPFTVERIVALGLAYYFFRFELFYWLRGIKG